MTKDKVRSTEEALRLALEALEVANSCVDGYYIPKGKTHLPEIELAIIAIKEALANEALEKMAENARELGLDYEPEPVPVAVVRWNDIGHISWRTHVMLSDDTPLYTTPPQRTWVGLTDEELNQIEGTYIGRSFARAIEVKLKAKNSL